MVGAVNSSALTLSKMQFVGRDQRQVAFEQLCDPLAGIEHAGFHRILRRADDLGDFGDRLFVIVDEVDDLAVRRRQLRQALPQDGDVVLLLQDHLGTVGVIWNLAMISSSSGSLVRRRSADIALSRAIANSQ